MLDDGSYDVLVVDARADDGPPASMHLDLTIVAGDHKGEVLAIEAIDLGIDELDLLGMPGTLTVDGAVPSFVVDR